MTSAIGSLRQAVGHVRQVFGCVTQAAFILRQAGGFFSKTVVPVMPAVGPSKQRCRVFQHPVGCGAVSQPRSKRETNVFGDRIAGPMEGRSNLPEPWWSCHYKTIVRNNIAKLQASVKG